MIVDTSNFDGRNFTLKLNTQQLKVMYHALSTMGSVQHKMVTDGMRTAGFKFNESDSEVYTRQMAMTLEGIAMSIIQLSADEIRKAQKQEEEEEAATSERPN
jgi:hypothetical protein